MGEIFTHTLRVRYGECDPQGILFNANYLAYFDLMVLELWRAAHGPWSDLEDRGLDAVLAEAQVRFRAPARFDDLIQLQARVTRLGTTSMTIAIDVVRDEDLLAEGTLRHVFVDAATWQKTEIPGWVRSALSPFQAE
jgi:acyl-CoA thioester hydrolase